MERTLSIVKPDGVQKGLVGTVISRFEDAKLRVLGMKMIHMTRPEAEVFYAVHRHQPFFASLTAFMASGPSVVLVVEGDDAIRRVRDLMGATDPAQAAPGTLRQQYGEDIERNVVHGSDGPDTARFELAYFFTALELCG